MVKPVRLFNAMRETVRDLATFGPQILLRFPATLMRRPTFAGPIPGGGAMSLRTRTSDLVVYRQVFRDREYDFTRLPQFGDIKSRYEAILASGKVPVVIDAGANIGAAGLWLARLFPKARVLMVEPDPANAACCRRNVADAAAIEVHEAAIGAEAGAVTLKNDGVEAWAVQTKRTAADAGGVRIVTVPELIASVPDGVLFVAKIDIEGFESDLFASNTDWIDAATVVMIEPHDWMMPGQGTSRSFQQAMAERDFELLISGENLIYVRRGAPTSH